MFLFKQGVEPRGIVASGTTTHDLYQDTHWDPKRRKQGKLANYVDVRFDRILGPDPSAFMPITSIQSTKRRRINWRTQMSGIEIRPGVVAELEIAWARFAKSEPRASGDRPIRTIENTLTEVKYYVRKRDRRIQQRAKAESNGICEACETDFRTLLGGLGLRALQVHHRKQLAASDKPRLTSPKDLAVVCANCHAMIHANSRRAMPVESLRRRLAHAK